MRCGLSGAPVTARPRRLAATSLRSCARLRLRGFPPSFALRRIFTSGPHSPSARRQQTLFSHSPRQGVRLHAERSLTAVRPCVPLVRSPRRQRPCIRAIKPPPKGGECKNHPDRSDSTSDGVTSELLRFWLIKKVVKHSLCTNKGRSQRSSRRTVRGSKKQGNDSASESDRSLRPASQRVGVTSPCRLRSTPVISHPSLLGESCEWYPGA
mgnify:CR=1 FL=1